VGVHKTYSYEEVESAIDKADHQYLRKLVRVRSDVSVDDWGKKKVKSDGSNPYAWRGTGSDVGHTFRHVKGTDVAGKSLYEDKRTAVLVTMELLNSAKGQQKLADLDSANPNGDEMGMDANRKIVSDVTGVHYGIPTGGGGKQRIRKAVCEIMKLGASTLWVHTTYPTRFDTAP
jgi:hypothetical protein